MKKCPLSSMHQRLERAHRFWHAAKEFYFDPEEFTANMNACISALRSTTFLLQKKKALFPSFDSWYSSWQEKMKTNEEMRWVKNSRNRIEKERDLELNSISSLKIRYGWNGSIELERQLNSSVPLQTVLDSFRDMAVVKNAPDGSMASLERKWSAEGLNGAEILATLSSCYGFLWELLCDAHRELELPIPKQMSSHGGQSSPVESDSSLHGGRLPCMVVQPFERLKWFQVPSFEAMRPFVRPTGLTEGQLSGIVNGHYKYLPSPPVDLTPGTTLQVKTEGLFQKAKRLLLFDGFHVPIVFAFNDQGKVLQVVVEYLDKAETVVAWSNVAQRLLAFGAREIIVMGEAWMLETGNLASSGWVEDSPERVEILFTCGHSFDGESCNRMVRLHRKGNELRLGPDESLKLVPRMLIPLFHEWAKLNK